MSFADTIKAKIKDADVERHLTAWVDEGEKLVTDSVSKAGDVAHDKRDDVEVWLDKASTKVNDKTDGKYADKVTQVRDTMLETLDKLAARRASAASAQSSAQSSPQPTDPTPLSTPEPPAGPPMS